MRVKQATIKLAGLDVPNFHKTGSIKGMKKIYGKNVLLVRSGSYIYNVDSCPEIYYNHAK